MEEGASLQSSSQEFCLRWNNFHSSLVSALDGFKNDSDFVDVTLACEGQFLKAHKMLLSACSVFFRDLLKANPCQHPIIILPPDVRFTDLEKMLRFIYQGEVNVQQEHLARFLKTAEMLKIRGLAEDGEKQKVLRSSSPRPPDTSSDRPSNIAASPKRPRLSVEGQASTSDDARVTTEGAGPSSADGDSEMIPVKQEMVELKDCDFDPEVDAGVILSESYIKESSVASTSSNSSMNTPSQSHPSAPPPPGPLLPSYVPPPQIKSQDDSTPSTNPEDYSQDFLHPEEHNSTSFGTRLDSTDSNFFDQSTLYTSGEVPWQRRVSTNTSSSDAGYIVCPHCYKNISAYNLNRHIRMVHAGMERAVCSICSKHFKNKYSLSTHVNRQHAESGYTVFGPSNQKL